MPPTMPRMRFATPATDRHVGQSVARLTASAVAAVPLALAACGPGENDPGPGGVTMEEARALDEAASMLDEQRLPPGALETQPAAPESSPAPAAPQQ